MGELIDDFEKIEIQLNIIIEKMKKLNIDNNALALASVSAHNTFFWLKRAITNN
jgi:hypothetical protein